MTTPLPRDVVRVASIPAGHPYVTRLGLDRAGIRVLADPPVPGAPPSRWWPPVMLEPAWITAHAGDFDVMHVHFGVESRSPASLEQTLGALHAAGRPLVYTVHDLTHPQLPAAEQARHLAHLDRLIPAAAAVITLTPGAAREISARWGRTAHVIAHPAMRAAPPPPSAVDPAAVAPVTPAVDPTAPPAIGIHLRDLRPGIDGPGSVALLAAALARLRAGGAASVRGRVWMHDRVRDAAAGDAVRRICAGLDPGADAIELVSAPRSTDAELEAQLAGLAVSLLPYRHGTHSGWLELCLDLGVPVAGPAFGHFADQPSDPAAYRSFAPGDPASLAAALAVLLTVPAAVAGSPARARTIAAVAQRRERDRPAISAAHGAIYRSVR